MYDHDGRIQLYGSIVNGAQHIPMIMDSIDDKERCKCEPQVTVDGKSYPKKAAKAD